MNTQIGNLRIHCKKLFVFFFKNRPVYCIQYTVYCSTVYCSLGMMSKIPNYLNFNVSLPVLMSLSPGQWVCS